MSRPLVRFNALEVGRLPRVVGILSRLETVQTFLAAPPPGCQLVEMRLDRMPIEDGAWVAAAHALEAAGFPVIATLRIPEEGGEWQAGDAARLPILKQALACCAAVDVELRSPVCFALADLALQEGKALIVSHHDYEKTPDMAVLQEIEQRAALHAQVVVKIAVRVQSAADIERLETFLEKPRHQPLCLIGMGDLGVPTRVGFPARGSCLAYGHLDESTAPGQLSCRELAERIHAQR